MEVRNIVKYHRIPFYNDIWGIRSPLVFAYSNENEWCAKINGIKVYKYYSHAQYSCFYKNLEDHTKLGILIKETPCTRNYKHKTIYYMLETKASFEKLFILILKEKRNLCF